MSHTQKVKGGMSRGTLYLPLSRPLKLSPTVVSTHTPEATAMAAEVLRWCAVFDLLIWPMAFTLPNALRASGDVMFTMAVSLGSMFLFRIGSSYVLACDWGLGLGLLGVWIGMIIDWGVRSVIFTIRFAQGKWKNHSVI